MAQNDFYVGAIDPPPTPPKITLVLYKEGQSIESFNTDVTIDDMSLVSLVKSWQRTHGFSDEHAGFLVNEFKMIRSVRQVGRYDYRPTP